MSIAVAVEHLGEEMARFGPNAFVLTTSPKLNPTHLQSPSGAR